MRKGYESPALPPRAAGIIIGVFVLLLALGLLSEPEPAWARNRVKAVGYVDGYTMYQQVKENEPDLGWREYATWARERLRAIEPYPRHYIEGFEEGVRDSYRGRAMDERPDEVDPSLRPPGALELLERPQQK